VTVVDVSVWVGCFLSDDIHYTRSLAWIVNQTASHGEFPISTPALAEIAGGLTRRAGSSLLGRRAVSRVLALPMIQLVPLDAVLGERAADIAATYPPRGTDAVYVAVAHAHGSTRLTWDTEIAARAHGLIRILEPA
jgi:predicted nucleic acid-binding protein